MKEDVVLQRIQEHCDERGWSRYKLAQESGMSYSTLNNLFNRGNTPTIPTLIKLIDGLGITLAQFFSEDRISNTFTGSEKKLIDRYRGLTSQNKKLLNAYLLGLESKK
jgi:transcriptional regulator with XRE-family HTH domain